MRNYSPHLHPAYFPAAQRLLSRPRRRVFSSLKLSHFQADEKFVPGNVRAVSEPIAALKKAALKNVHVKKAPERPSGNATQEWFKGTMSARRIVCKKVAPRNSAC